MNPAAPLAGRSRTVDGRRFSAATASARCGDRLCGASANREPEAPDLVERVVSALVKSGYAALSFIGCEVEHDRVILRGSVPSYHLKQLAQVYAQRIAGIGAIENRLVVQKHGRR